MFSLEGMARKLTGAENALHLSMSLPLIKGLIRDAALASSARMRCLVVSVR